MTHTPTHTADANQPGKNRGQPQPDSLENDDRGTKPYQKQSQEQSQNQTQREAMRDKRERDPNFIGDPPPADEDTIHADDEEGALQPDNGTVENVDLPIPTDDSGELGSTSERH